jgi:uncharacterized protein
MFRTLTSSAILIESSAIIALKSPTDQFHDFAKSYFNLTQGVRWVVMNSTSHESYTRLRYDIDLRTALGAYDWLRGFPFHRIPFDNSDEEKAREILERYGAHVFSYHDALCAAFMLRVGIYRIFSFDKHFWILGFQVEPGITK